MDVEQAYSLTRVCGPDAPLAAQAVWLVLLPTVLDFVVLDAKMSVGLLGVHVVMMWLAAGVGLGGRHGSGMCYGVAEVGTMG